MHRLLATAIYAYAGLSAAQWGHATRYLHAPPDVFICGNAISFPFELLVNVIGPLAALCAAVLARWCIRSHRWPCFAITALLTFAGTSACLAYESYVLDCYGLEMGYVWWLPWR